ncbi:MAG: hypothetical protein CMJ78_08400 [Planctomycetaceae bacterium]|nr:hypothetical protein [Planctomycetaceae bacterium]
MKRIVVTGGAGRLGVKVVESLVAKGYDVVAVDLVRPETQRCRFLTVDLTDPGPVFDTLKGTDAVIHLGAIPGPVSHPQSTTFRNNVQSTWNVTEAAATLGLQKIVFASSVFTLGWHEAADVYWPQYAPVDESHLLTPFEAYGLSKVIGEDIVAAASRQSGITAVSLRIMNVIQEEVAAHLPWPTPTQQQPVRFVLWPYVYIDDAAMSCCQALEARTSGHEAMFIAAEDIRFAASTETLLREFSPRTQIRGSLSGRQSVISIEKARQLIGYAPKFSWQST